MRPWKQFPLEYNATHACLAKIRRDGGSCRTSTYNSNVKIWFVHTEKEAPAVVPGPFAKSATLRGGTRPETLDLEQAR
jgi:hypothetical protein